MSLETKYLLKAFQLHYCPDNDAKNMVKLFIFLQKFAVLRFCDYVFLALLTTNEGRKNQDVYHKQNQYNHKIQCSVNKKSNQRSTELQFYKNVTSFVQRN